MRAFDYKSLTEQYRFEEELRRDIARILDDHNHRPARPRRGSNVCSYKTQYRRAINVCLSMQELHAEGFKIKSAGALDQRHVRALVNCWQRKQLDYGTVDNKLSYMRALATWVGKRNMIPSSKELWGDAPGATRNRIVTESKCWSDHGVQFDSVLQRIRDRDMIVSLQLELCWAFGLRVEEAMLMPVVVALDEALNRACLNIQAGTKGGLVRRLPLRDPLQIETLIRCSDYVKHSKGTMIPKEKTLTQWKNHFYHIVRSAGVRKTTGEGGLGVTVHGLRHEYLNRRFEEIAGTASPVRGGDWDNCDPVLVYAALMSVVRDAGHRDISKGGAYVGKPPSFTKLSRLLTDREQEEKSRTLQCSD